MSTILYIKANPKPDEVSRTFQIANSFIEAYLEAHPGDKVEIVDLYKEDIKFLTGDNLANRFLPKTPESRNNPTLKYAYQFAEADKYVFAEPLWNLGVPAILKAYIDYVSATGITFNYTEKGPVGALQGKKAVNIVSRGGDYSSAPMNEFELGDRYLRTILGFFGVRDYTTIAADKLDVKGLDTEALIAAAIAKAKEIARTF